MFLYENAAKLKRRCRSASLVLHALSDIAEEQGRRRLHLNGSHIRKAAGGISEKTLYSALMALRKGGFIRKRTITRRMPDGSFRKYYRILMQAQIVRIEPRTHPADAKRTQEVPAPDQDKPVEAKPTPRAALSSYNPEESV